MNLTKVWTTVNGTRTEVIWHKAESLNPRVYLLDGSSNAIACFGRGFDRQISAPLGFRDPV